APSKGHPKGQRDVDRVRFRAAEAEDQAPTARLLAGSDIVFPGIATRFDGSQSHDPESDSLTYSWDFGDGGTSADAIARREFACDTRQVPARWRVSAGTQSPPAQVTLPACPPLDDSATPGIIVLAADQSLEFGATTSPVTRVVTVRNADNTPTSQLHVR